MRGFRSAQVFVVFTNKRRSCRHDDLKIDAACLGARAAGPYSTVVAEELPRRRSPPFGRNVGDIPYFTFDKVELPRRKSPPFGRGWNPSLQCANEYHRWATRGMTGDHHQRKQRALTHATDISLTPRVSPSSPHCTAVPSRVKMLKIPVPDNQRFSEFLRYDKSSCPANAQSDTLEKRLSDDQTVP